MKKFFEEPKLCVEQFTVSDVLTASNWNGIGLEENETNFISPFGKKPAIG